MTSTERLLLCCPSDKYQKGRWLAMYEKSLFRYNCLYWMYCMRCMIIITCPAYEEVQRSGSDTDHHFSL